MSVEERRELLAAATASSLGCLFVAIVGGVSVGVFVAAAVCVARWIVEVSG